MSGEQSQTGPSEHVRSFRIPVLLTMHEALRLSPPSRGPASPAGGATRHKGNRRRGGGGARLRASTEAASPPGV